MYTLIRTIPLTRFITEQGLALGVSLILAEMFYKFHSFTLECITFLATWYVLDFLIQTVRHWNQPEKFGS